MIVEAVSVAIKLIMNNHIYVFDGKVLLQEDEGSIGMRLTGILAEIVMIFWCKKLAEKLENLGVKNELLPRYVDDITMLPTVIQPGMRFENDKLELNEKYVTEDEKVNDDKRTMDVIEKVANSICVNIQVTYDVPSNYDDGKIPILDVKAGLNSENKIEFQFYQKPMTNPLVTLKSSALPMNQKITILTQQCFTRLHNTSENTDEKIKVEILNDFMKELKASEYTEKDRENILKGAVNTFKNIKSQELLKIRPFYRDNKFEKEKRKRNKSKKRNTWYQGKQCDSNYKSVLFVEATPGDTLIKRLKETEERFKIAENCRIKLVSKSGNKLSSLIEKKNPFAVNCNEIECPPL